MFAKQIQNGLDLSDTAKRIAAVYDTSLESGQGIPLHYHPDFEEIYYILSGYGLMTIGDENQEISRGEVVYIPALAPHSLQNTGNIILRFMTVTVNISRNKNEDMPPYIV